jgi:hypothetical protein
MRFADIKNDIAFRKIFGNEQKTAPLVSFLNASLELEDDHRVVSVSIAKMSNRSTALVFAILILFIACNKGENPPIDQGDMFDCHHKMAWDSLSTKETLIGEWEWEYVACFWNAEDANGDAFDGMTIEFKQDNTLDVKENGQITQTSNWKVVNGDGDLFAIDVDPSVPQLYGRILFCEGRVEFNYSYIDGCDNYFKKNK